MRPIFGQSNANLIRNRVLRFRIATRQAMVRAGRSAQARGESAGMAKDAVMFLKSWVAQPLRVGAVSPSGDALAELMTRHLGPDTGRVLELGPGTGVFTQRILDRAVAPQDLTVVEADPTFAHHMRSRFPGLEVRMMDAARLRSLRIHDARGFGAVISGLPLVSMSRRKVFAILQGAFDLLDDGGTFTQFTYSARSPVPQDILDRLGLTADRVGHTFRNLPPARVFRLRRRGRV